MSARPLSYDFGTATDELMCICMIAEIRACNSHRNQKYKTEFGMAI